MSNQLKSLPLLLSETNNKSLFFSSVDKSEPDEIRPGFGVRIIAPYQSLGNAFASVITTYNFPFRNVRLKGISTLHSGDISNLIPVLQDIQKDKTITIVLGNDASVFKTCFDALQFCENYFDIAAVQPSMGTDRGIDPALMDLQKPWLQRLTLIGSQAPLSDPGFAEEGFVKGLDHIRLGAMRDQLGIAEPEIRDADIFAIDINALRYCDASIQSRPTVVGFSAEEASQLAYYAGRAERNKIFCLFGFKEGASKDQIGMDLLSNLVWYYLYGVEHRQKTYPPSRSPMSTYILDHQIADYKLTFYKDDATEKWWVESPFPKRKLSQNFPLIACDYHDYALAANDQLLSKRLERAFAIYQASSSVED